MVRKDAVEASTGAVAGSFGPHPQFRLTLDHIQRLRTKFQIPPEVEIVIPSPATSLESVVEGYCCASYTYFDKCGLFFPIPRIMSWVLAQLQLAFHQMTPNFVRYVIGLGVRAVEEGVDFGAEELMRVCSVKHNTRFPETYYLSPRHGKIVDEIPTRDAWKNKYFFFRINHHSVKEFDYSVIPTRWAASVG